MLKPGDAKTIKKAFNMAMEAHKDMRRKSGEPYIYHPLSVAQIAIDEIGLGTTSIVAALLHDVVEDTDVELDDIKREFGIKVARIIDGLTKISGVFEHGSSQQAENFRKMLLTLSDDVRVILIKLADRLHNMRTLGYMPEHKQERIARETMDIFAPLANRLGIWQIKWELEDLSFRYLNREAYRAIAKSLDERRSDREQYVREIERKLRKELTAHGIHDPAITARPKHIYSIYKKMKRKDLPLEQIYDVRAVRVIVDRKVDCYVVLSIVHDLWRPIPGEFDDYIASPKDNFYRSLHTAVYDEQGKTLEVQIRTRDMHEDAEYGIAAHWRYKEGFGRNDTNFETKLTWLRGLIEWRREMTDAREFVESLKSDVFQDQVYVFTPKGKIIDLPVGSTPVDFAYRIHSEVGHRCVGAKINGRLVSLDHQLRNGEIIQIMTSKAPRGPSRDWLNFVETSSARNHIRRYFRRQERDENIAAGRDLLEKELKRLGLGYDWFHGHWDADTLQTLRKAIVDKGLKPGLRGGWWVKSMPTSCATSSA